MKRNHLYNSAGIKAFWILGMSVLQRNKEKKSPLENAIYQDNQRVFYLDAITKKVIVHERFLYKFNGINFDVCPDVSITSNISAVLIQPEKGPGAIRDLHSQEIRLSL
ncbi:hypothetical protein [Brevibacillus porteri]|uniref:competence protein CoiA family protein n=1 Tax=Brevibacillus porteri TaxID=2126350 RepID=UPI003CC5D8FE